jgi:WD40 repeat protein
VNEKLVDTALGIGRVALRPDGTRVAVPCDDGTLRIVRLDDGRMESQAALNSSGLTLADYSPDGELLLALDRPGPRDRSRGATARIWRVATGEVKVSSEPCWYASFAPDGRHALLYPQDECLLVDVESEQRVELPGASPRHALWSPDGSLLAIVDAERRVSLFEGRSLEPLGVTLEQPADGYGLSFDPRGGRLAAGCGDARARIWDIETGRCVQVLSHEDQDLFGDLAVGCVAYSPDGLRVVTTSFSFWEVRCWEADSGRLLWAFDYNGGNPGAIQAGFSSDGSRVYVSGGTPRVARVVDAATGETLADLGKLGTKVLRSRDDRQVVVAGDKALHVLDGTSLLLRYTRAEFEKLGSALHVPAGFVDADAGALRPSRVRELDGAPFPLECYAARLLDPKKVRAALAGVAIEPAELSPLPQLELSPAERHVRTLADSMSIEALAKHDGPLLGFELVRDGIALPKDVVRAATMVSDDGRSAQLDWKLAGPGAETTLRVCAVARDGLRSGWLSVTVRFD